MKTMVQEIVVTETEWWDRVAMALDILAAREKTTPVKLRFEGRILEWFGDDRPRGAAGGDESLFPEYTVYAYARVNNTEVIRRLTQWPDETPKDELSAPFHLFAPTLKSAVSVNDSDFSLKKLLDRLDDLRNKMKDEQGEEA